MKKMLIVVLVLMVLFAAVRISTSVYENMQREKTEQTA